MEVTGFSVGMWLCSLCFPLWYGNKSVILRSRSNGPVLFPECNEAWWSAILQGYTSVNVFVENRNAPDRSGIAQWFLVWFEWDGCVEPVGEALTGDVLCCRLCSRRMGINRDHFMGCWSTPRTWPRTCFSPRGSRPSLWGHRTSTTFPRCFGK